MANEKAIKGNKKSKRRPDANRKVMSFDFTANDEENNKSSDKESTPIGGIIADAFEFNENSQATMQSKLQAYKNDQSDMIDKGFSMFKRDKQNMSANHHGSSHSFTSHGEIIYGDSRKDLKGKKVFKPNFQVKSSKKPSNYPVKPYSYDIAPYIKSFPNS